MKDWKFFWTFAKYQKKTPNQICHLVCCGVEFLVCFECLGFHLRLSLSMNGRMTCVRLNFHLAVQKFSHLFYWKWLNGNLVRHFKIKTIFIFGCELPNGYSNDLCMDELPFGHSHSNSKANANANLGIQDAGFLTIYSYLSCTSVSQCLRLPRKVPLFEPSSDR